MSPDKPLLMLMHRSTFLLNNVEIVININDGVCTDLRPAVVSLAGEQGFCAVGQTRWEAIRMLSRAGLSAW
jgi:hypothetical protein